MVPAKARPVNLVLRSPWSARDNPPQDLGCPVNLGNDDEGQGDHTCTRRLVRTTPLQKSNVLKRGDRKMLKVQIPGNSLIRRKLQTLLVQGEVNGQQVQET